MAVLHGVHWMREKFCKTSWMQLGSGSITISFLECIGSVWEGEIARLCTQCVLSQPSDSFCQPYQCFDARFIDGNVVSGKASRYGYTCTCFHRQKCTHVALNVGFNTKDICKRGFWFLFLVFIGSYWEGFWHLLCIFCLLDFIIIFKKIFNRILILTWLFSAPLGWLLSPFPHMGSPQS